MRHEVLWNWGGLRRRTAPPLCGMVWCGNGRCSYQLGWFAPHRTLHPYLSSYEKSRHSISIVTFYGFKEIYVNGVHGSYPLESLDHRQFKQFELLLTSSNLGRAHNL